MEPVVEADAKDIVGDPRAPAIRSAEVSVEAIPADSSQIDVEVFKLPSPVAAVWEGPFDPGTHGPADIGCRIAI